METRQLQTFVTLAGTLNYQRAAEQLQYAPSSLFKHIQLLEEELGVPLFCKNGRKLELTWEGRRFLPEAERLLDEWDKILRATRASDQAHVLAIGGCELNTSYAMRDMLQQFIAAYPDVRFNMTTSPNADAPELVRGGQADLCFYYSLSTRRPGGFQGALLYSELVSPSVAAGHPLLSRNRVTWADLADYPLAHPHESCVFYEGYLQQLEEQGLSPARTAFLGNITLVARQAVTDGAVMLVPAQSRRHMQEEYGVLPLPMDDRPLRFWESVLYRRDAAQNPSVRRMVRFAVQYAAAQIAAHPDTLLPPSAGKR